MSLRRSSRLANISSNSNSICSNITDFIFIEDDEPPKTTNCNEARIRKKSKSSNSRTRNTSNNKRSKPHPRPVTINLDVTYSSDSSGESELEEEKKSKKKKPRKKKNIWPSVEIRENRCTISDDSDDVMEVVTPKKKETPTTVSYESDEENLYRVNVADVRSRVFSELKSSLDSNSPDGHDPVTRGEEKRAQCLDSDQNHSTNGFQNEERNATKENKMANKDDLSQSIELTDIDLSVVSVKSSSKPRRSKKTKSAIASLQAFSKQIVDFEDDCVLNDSLADDDVIVSDDCDIRVRVRIRSIYERFSLNKNRNLVDLYQELADKYNASVNQVILSFNDRVISYEQRPKDIGLNNGDILEGGIISEDSLANGRTAIDERDAEETLSLKVQTSNRKITHNVSMSKYDKLSVLMEKYSKLRGIPLHKLLFKFDGEKVNPKDTPSSLELEGEECIDVFEL